MRTDRFFDSNVILYSVGSDPTKSATSLRLLTEGGTISVQVLNEFTNVARKGFKNSWPTVTGALAAVRSLCTVVPVTLETHERGLRLAQAHHFQLYDAMIVAAAQLAGCATLYSEDMHDGMTIDGLTIRNPYT